MSKALLVIDVDHGNKWSSNIEDLNEDREQVALAIRQTLAEWRASKGMIIFVVLTDTLPSSQIDQIATDNKRLECIVCDLPANERLAGFLEHRHGAGYEPAFTKTTCDAFTNSELIGFLRSNGVTEVVLAGCSTFACVLHTAQGAVKNNFGVTLLERCTDPPFRYYEEKKHWIRSVTAEKADIPVVIA